MKLGNMKYFKNGTLRWENMHFSRTTNGKAPHSQCIAQCTDSPCCTVLGTCISNESAPTSYSFSYWLYSAVLNNSLF